MARRVGSANLESREARRKLKARGRPYYRGIERELHIGYRRNRPGIPGSWSGRRYLGEGHYDENQLGIADDLSESDGKTVLDYWQAVEVYALVQHSLQHSRASSMIFLGGTTELAAPNT